MNANRYRFITRTIPFLDDHTTRGPGPLALRSGAAPHLLVWHPEHLAGLFGADRDMAIAGSSTIDPIVGTASLLLTTGARHHAYRTVIGEQLRGRKLVARRPVLSAPIERAVAALVPGHSFDPSAWSRQLTLRIIGDIVLGKADDSLLADFAAWIHGALGAPFRTFAYRYLRLPPPIGGPWRDFLRQRAALDPALVAAGRAATAESGTPPLARTLIEAQPVLGALDDTELRDQLVSLLFPGHETTASAVAWALFRLAVHDRLRRDLLDELAATDADGSDAKRTPLLHAACLETLRLTPPTLIGENRVLTQTQVLDGATWPPGTRLTPCIYIAHRHPDTYRRPREFVPERFLGRRRPGSVYLPFGGGTRRCPGADLALMEMRMILAAVLRSVGLSCPDPLRATPQTRGAAMGPHRSLRLTATRLRP
ncbi:cytochrome P450 [Streptomyces albofaciens JCM 4342]|uniref:cytochrome P450 n=1 Tax=Streptomyces albofaciens TaxID=66866 RepID=UPI00123871F9|nr:cytochrome P450 [Streptomyces albofaciens]KAA6212903.1 cytochrome P450 [Streptomyces albofaciens JCM 4342]